MARILILGDVKVEDECINVGAALRKLCKEADHVIANLEGPIIWQGKSKPEEKKARPLASSNKIGKLFDDLNIDVVTMGNNHIADYGKEGISETIEYCRARSIAFCGAVDDAGNGGDLVVLEDCQVALLSYAHREGIMAAEDGSACGPFPLPEKNQLLAKVNELRAKGYRILVSYHGGEEFFSSPWSRRLGWSQNLCESGVTLVFGHHSHCVQPVWDMGGSYTALGLGNAYFDSPYQRRHKGTQQGICLIFDTQSGQVEYVRLQSNWDDRSLELANDVSLEPKQFSLDEALNDWCRQCRKKVWGNRLNTLGSNTNWIKRVARSGVYVGKVVKSRFVSIRDTDIVLSAIPVLGEKYARKAFIAGKDCFNF